MSQDASSSPSAPTRRSLLVGAAGVAVAAALPARSAPWQLGAQSYSFRTFSVAEAIDRLQQLGLAQMEFYPGHFPAMAEGPEADQVLELLAREKVLVPAFGVVGFDSDEAKTRSVMAFARRFGIGIVSANPSAESLDGLDRIARDSDVRIAIHNHGPGHRYATLEHLQVAVRGRSSHVGVCLDTGHALRSGQDPVAMIHALAERVHAVHLKDWIVGGEEQILGEGDLDLRSVARALRDIGFSGPLSLEYELQPENPVPGMRRGLENWASAQP